jgi:hypothetical protein
VAPTLYALVQSNDPSYAFLIFGGSAIIQLSISNFVYPMHQGHSLAPPFRRDVSRGPTQGHFALCFPCASKVSGERLLGVQEKPVPTKLTKIAGLE